MRNRVFRCLVCFALICCILVNCSPIRVQATVVGAAAVTGTAAAGICGLLFSMAMGVVFVDITADMLTGIGESFTSSLYDHYADDEETTNTVLSPWFEGLEYNFGGSGDDGSSNGDDNITLIPSEIIGGFFAWIYEIINGDGIQVEGEAAPEGYAYYNGFCLPTFSGYDNYPYRLIYVDDSGIYRMVASSNPGWCVVGSSSEGETWVNVYTNIVYKFVLDGDNWSRDGAFYPYQFGFSHRSGYYTLIWSNHDLCFSDGSVFLAGSEPSSTYTETITPSIYVGDIPQQVQDDTFEEDKYELPYINYTQLFQNQTDAIDALNNVATQLQNQTMTYEEYMEQVKTPSSSGGSGSDTDVDTGTDSDTDTGDKENEVTKQLSDLTLDLSDYFPFCIPFDLYDFFACLNAEPVAPVISWEIPVPGGEPQELEIDLSVFDEVAQLLRRLQLLLFCVGLAFKTRDLIKG